MGFSKLSNSKNEILLKETKRPADYANPSSTLAYMVDPNINLINPVIEEITRVNGTVVSASGNKYLLENGRVNLKATYTYNNTAIFAGSTDGLAFGNEYELAEDFTRYDNTSGKLLQYTDRNGVLNSFIWGYNNKLPIVHGLGIAYDPLLAAHTAALSIGAFGTDAYESAIRNNINTLGKQVSTYVHNPLVGVAKVTNPQGIKISFHYDPFSRLQKVIDKDGYTTEQYQYHFKERQPTRIAVVSGNLNFGTLTPDMYATQFIPYVRCSDPLRTRRLTITNNGEDDLTINTISVSPPTSAFVFSWQGGRIAPATSVDLEVTFNSNAALASYSGTVMISSNKTNSDDISVPISANYSNRTCNLSFTPVTVGNPSVFDVGTTTGNFATNYLTVTNNGNATLRLAGTPVNWDGLSANYPAFTSPDFNVVMNTNCIDPGQSIQLQINFTPQLGPNGVRTAKLSFVTDVGSCPALKDAITIQGNVQRPISIISMDTSPIDFGNFTEAFKAKTIAVTNTGTLAFNVTGLSFSNPAAAPHFSMTPATPFVLNPNQTVNVVITFQPTQFDLNLTSNIILNNDAMYGEETIAFSGNRYSYRKMVLSTEQTGNELLFDSQFETKSVTISNQGNANLSVTGFTPPNTSLQYYQVSSFTPTSLSPGQSMVMQVFRTTDTSSPETITVTSDKNDGINTFTARGKTRIIGLSTANIAFAPFSTPSTSQDIVINNTGNAPLTISSVSSTNSMFTSSLNSTTILPGGQQTVTVTFTPSAFNFSQQTGTITFNSDKTSGSASLSLSGQRTSLRMIQLSSNNLIFDFTGQQQTVSITNQGNDNLNVTGISYPNTPNWSASITPALLAPGQNTTLTIVKTNGTPETINIIVNSNKTSGNEVVQVSFTPPPTKIISLSSVTFGAFTAPTATQNLVVTNNGNSTLSVTGISSNNPRFTLSATSFTVPAGGNQTVVVTYTPTDFSLQSSTITVTSDATSGTNTVSTSAQRSQLAQLTPSTTLLAVKPSTQTPSATLTNTGNVAVTINSPGSNSNPSRFAIAHQTFNGVIFVNATFPVTLQPGQQMNVVASTAQSGDFSSANGTLTINTTNAGSIVINLTRSTF